MKINGLKPTVTARIRVEVDIAVGSSWGVGCSFEQIVDQAKEEGVAILRKAISDADGRIIGEPSVIAIVAAEKGL